MRISLARGLLLDQALGKQSHRGIQLPALPLCPDDPKHFPRIFKGLKMLLAITELLHGFQKAPPVQFLKTRADIGPGHR